MSKLEKIVKEFNLKEDEGTLKSEMTKSGRQVLVNEEEHNYLLVRITEGKRILFQYSTKISSIDIIIRNVKKNLK